MQTRFPQLSRILDISMDTGAYTFPGNPPLERSGPHNRVSGPVREYVYDLRLCTQSGTHIQSGHYFLKDGETMDQVALERCQGWCRLVPLAKKGEDTTRQDLESLFRQHPLEERMILFVTGHMEEIIATGTCSPESRSGLSPEAAAYLVEEQGGNPFGNRLGGTGIEELRRFPGIPLSRNPESASPGMSRKSEATSTLFQGLPGGFSSQNRKGGRNSLQGGTADTGGMRIFAKTLYPLIKASTFRRKSLRRCWVRAPG